MTTAIKISPFIPPFGQCPRRKLVTMMDSLGDLEARAEKQIGTITIDFLSYSQH